ncbi:hypothetical protein V5O48_018007 [Marasmius crinis-equi]|uniref:Tyr recombinase domain-containing protein n=1 Tax=Marasmius crinis-equi TaxID=585013 RepID=A0ABR3EMD1_9AGAR
MAPTPSKVLLQCKGLYLAASEYEHKNEDFMLEVGDDLECEQQTIGFVTNDNEDEDEDEGGHGKDSTSHDKDGDSQMDSAIELNTELKDILKTVSKGVSDGTDASYRSLMKQCTKFVWEKGWIGPQEDFFRASPHPESAEMIVAWILTECDSYTLDGSVKPPDVERSTYTHAQKMRASATFGFGRVCGLGNRAWEVSEVTGKMLGNPSVSQQVSLYMVSLRRRKARAGETPTSARAVTSELLGKLYDFNLKHYDIKDYAPKKRAKKSGDAEGSSQTADQMSEPWEWGGGRFRRLLHCAYTIAFACLLRVDEVLKIQVHDVELEEDNDGWKMKVTLPFRKTEQFGDIQPFYLRQLPEEMRHLCPVRAFADCIAESDIREGFLFRRIDSADRPVLGRNKPMTSAKFLEGFRNNLLDINVDPAPYGTHSFRRGGCQWLSVDLRWPIRKILSHLMER